MELITNRTMDNEEKEKLKIEEAKRAQLEVEFMGLLCDENIRRLSNTNLPASNHAYHIIDNFIPELLGYVSRLISIANRLNNIDITKKED